MAAEGMEHKGLYRNCIKRLLDIVISALALILLSPLFLVTALLVRIRLGSPVIFTQARPGYHEKIFRLRKFRSMTDEVGEDGRLLPDAQRLTGFGRFLRASSLDELPELINILKGEMSLVGPRPLSIYYLPHYPAELRRRHDVRPGLTGLAQVRGRNNLPWDERFAMDIEYVDSLSFVTDLKIVLSTFLKVLKREDVSVRGTTAVRDYGPYSVLNEEKDGGTKVEEMTYSEIGSYFWLEGGEEVRSGASAAGIDWLPPAEDSCFTFSGRNAIDAALRDILKNRRIDRVLFPSYSCVSMLQSFADRGMDVEFYDVGYEEGAFTYRIPEADGHTAAVIMSYFGLDNASCREEIRKLHAKGAVVIEDITHSMLRSDPASEDSDYRVASLRKWLPVPAGGWIGKRRGTIAEKPDMDSNHAVEEKIAAMGEKYDYLTGRIAFKEHFLLAQARFDNDLIHVDRSLRIDDTSLAIAAGTDIGGVIGRRRENAGILLEGLADLEGKVLELPRVDLSADTPLFMPVFMKTEDRDALRKYLIDRGIYCPVHWPEVMGADAGLRANELSLICDQRYGEGDMKAIADAIHRWYRKEA